MDGFFRETLRKMFIDFIRSPEHIEALKTEALHCLFGVGNHSDVYLELVGVDFPESVSLLLDDGLFELVDSFLRADIHLKRRILTVDPTNNGFFVLHGRRDAFGWSWSCRKKKQDVAGS
jgi:hypothetical protein